MSSDLKVLGSGDGGLEELAEEWDDSKILYAFARVVEPISNLPKCVFISWCGDGVPVAKKGLFHSHVNDAVKFFRGFHVHINARAEIDVTPDAIMKKIKDSSGAKYSIHNEGAKKSAPPAPVVSFCTLFSSHWSASQGSSYTPIQTTPKPMSSSPAAFNKPTSSYVPPPFNKPASPAASTSPLYRPAPSYTSAPAAPRFSKTDAPTSFVPPAPVVSALPAGLNAKAIFTYVAQEANEINFKEGDIITAIVKVDDGWWQGKNPQGQVGLFPCNYVEEVELAPAPTPIAAPSPAPALFNRPSVSQQQPQPGVFNRPAVTPVSEPPRPSVTSPSTYMSSAANKWLGDDEPKKVSGYAASFVPATPAEDRVAAEKERREREDREARERAELEVRQRDERARKEVDEREERQREAALAATAAPPAPIFGSAPVSTGLFAKAMYAYDAQEDNEISFAEGEIINAIEKLDEGWWQGTNAAGRVGLFPATYVEEVSSAPVASNFFASTPAAPPAAPPSAAPAADQVEAIALYDYAPTEDNEIGFAAGDRITNIVFISDDWWQGRVNGVDGLFPGNYVEVQK
ncbi:hypothetical protein BC830DRAFT_1106842 [Chytriomyces sp. MP71]|nr:hypothetical protein BC830DRAFT_1106842 [Chytriomyces sp. MP71]